MHVYLGGKSQHETSKLEEKKGLKVVISVFPFINYLNGETIKMKVSRRQGSRWSEIE